MAVVVASSELPSFPEERAALSTAATRAAKVDGEMQADMLKVHLHLVARAVAHRTWFHLNKCHRDQVVGTKIQSHS